MNQTFNSGLQSVSQKLCLLLSAYFNDIPVNRIFQKKSIHDFQSKLVGKFNKDDLFLCVMDSWARYRRINNIYSCHHATDMKMTSTTNVNNFHIMLLSPVFKF